MPFARRAAVLQSGRARPRSARNPPDSARVRWIPRTSRSWVHRVARVDTATWLLDGAVANTATWSVGGGRSRRRLAASPRGLLPLPSSCRRIESGGVGL